MKKIVCFALLSLTIVGCRLVLDDNPPEESAADDESTDAHNALSHEEDVKGFAYLNNQDPRLFMRAANGAGTTVLMTGSRLDDGRVESLESVEFRDESGVRVLDVFNGHLTYKTQDSVYAQVVFSETESGAVVRVHDTSESWFQTFNLTLDNTLVNVASTEAQTDAETNVPASSTMASYYESSGYLVVQPTACGLPVTSDIGTELNLALEQEGILREYPVRLDEDGVWRTSMPVAGGGSSVSVSPSHYSDSLKDAVEAVCAGNHSGSPGEAQDSDSLIQLSRSLARHSESTQALFPNIESDLQQLCSTFEGDTASFQPVTEPPFDADGPMTATLTLTQGVDARTSQVAWTMEPGEHVSKVDLVIDNTPMLVGALYTSDPLYLGDAFTVTVLSQCAQEHSVKVEARQLDGEVVVQKTAFIVPESKNPYETNFDPLFEVAEEARYQVGVELLDVDHQVVDELIIKPNVR